MLLMYIWIYTFILAMVWWFFIVAKIHSYKFKNFSTNIENVTKILLWFLIFLSLLWYLVIIFWYDSKEAQIDFWDTNIWEIDY